MRDCAAILLAAGKGERLRQKQNKIFSNLAGKSLLQRCLENICLFPKLKTIILVIAKRDEKKIRKLLNLFKNDFLISNKYSFHLVFGGKARWESSIKGVQQFLQLKEKLSCFFIHDLARPFVSIKLLTKLYKSCNEYKVAIPFLPLKDTIWLADSRSYNQLKKENLLAAQTPQFFSANLANDFKTPKTSKCLPTDDLFFINQNKYKICWVKGEETNIKITTKFDLDFANFLLNKT